MLNKLAQEVHQNNVAKGFYEEPKSFAEIIALIHSEVSEALEAHRSGNYNQITKAQKEFIEKIEGNENYSNAFKSTIKDSCEDEIADAFIRLLDLVGYLNIDIDWHITHKLKYNKTRPYKHNKNY